MFNTKCNKSILSQNNLLITLRISILLLRSYHRKNATSCRCLFLANLEKVHLPINIKYAYDGSLAHLGWIPMNHKMRAVKMPGIFNKVATCNLTTCTLEPTPTHNLLQVMLALQISAKFPYMSRVGKKDYLGPQNQ